MITLYRLGMRKFPKTQVNQLDEHLTRLGFSLSEDGAFYNKIYKTSGGILNMGVICDASNIYDLMAFGKAEGNINKSILRFENIYNTNANAIKSLSMTKTAAGMGTDGGAGGLHNVNLDETFGGPRWWSYESDSESLDELQSWILEQYRYNPEYLSVGRPIQIGDDEFTIIGTINGNVDSARLNRDRQEVFLEYMDNNKTYKIPMSSLKQTMESGKYDGDLAQEMGKYKLKIVKVDNKSIVLMRKGDTRGDIRGIWEINGKDPVPGFAYVDEDWKTSYSMHPEFLDDPNWTAGEWSPGRTRSNII